MKIELTQKQAEHLNAETNRPGYYTEGNSVDSQDFNRAKFERTRFEVGTGAPGYRWVEGVYIIKPTGEKLYPPMRKRDAIAYCRREGWDHSSINTLPNRIDGCAY